MVLASTYEKATPATRLGSLLLESLLALIATHLQLDKILLRDCRLVIGED
jgi:hypothetical protein